MDKFSSKEKERLEEIDSTTNQLQSTALLLQSAASQLQSTLLQMQQLNEANACAIEKNGLAIKQLIRPEP